MSTGPLDLSLTVVSHGHLPFIQRYLPSLFSTGCRATFEVLLIDNAEAGDAAAWVCQHLPDVQVLHNAAPRSFAENINEGMRRLRKGRHFVVSNPDIQYLPGLFDAALAFLDAQPDVGVLGPQLLNADGSHQDSCRGFSTPWVTLVRGLHLDRVFGQSAAVRRYLLRDADRHHALDVDWVTGALMFVRREAIAAVGGMDERYGPAYSEDQDWCCRMWRAGWRVCWVPDARAVHDHQREGMRRPWSRMGRAQLVNTWRLFHKFQWQLSRSATGDTQR
jgi:GT2 family glycosyltransferase